MPNEQFITTEQLIGRALDHGVELGPNPHQTIELYTQQGLVPPKLINGMHPTNVVDRLIAIQNLLAQGKTLEEIHEIIRQERRSFLSKASNLITSVSTYKISSKGLLMLSSLATLVLFSYTLVTKSPVNFAKAAFENGSYVAKEVGKPVGLALVNVIKSASPENSNSLDPLGLTKIDKVITVNEKQEIVIEKTIVSSADNSQTQSQPGNLVTLDENGGIDITGDISIGGVFAGDGSGLTSLTLPNTLLYNDQTYSDPLWLASIDWTKMINRANLISSVDGVKNDLGDIDFIAGTGVTITPNDANNTLTFTASVVSSNADLLDSLDSTSFLRSDTSDNFTSGTLTLDSGTTFDVNGTLAWGGSTITEDLNNNNQLIVNIGAAGTDFTSGGGLNIATDLDVNGHAAIGSSASVSASYLLNINETSSLSGARGIYLAPTFNPSAGTTVNSFHNEPTLSPTGGVTSQLRGIYERLVIGGSATVLTANGIYIDTPSISGSTVANLYGLYIADQTGATTNYQIYQAGATGTNYFNAGTSTFGRVATGNDTLYRAVIEGSLCVDDTTANCPAGPTAGAIYVENSVGSGNVSAFDISEYYPASEPVEKGDLVVVDTNGVATVKRSSTAYAQSLIGIVATDPAMVIDENNITFGKTAGDKFNPLKPYIALAGRVPTKVSGENGPIQPGDPITSSSTPGIGMKATSLGPIVGRALEAFTGGDQGKILVFVNPGWYSPTEIDQVNNLTVNLTSSTKFEWKNPLGQTVAWVDHLGQALFSKVTSTLGDFQTIVFGQLKVKSSSQSAGNAKLGAEADEVWVASDKVSDKSLINITATSEPDGFLYVKEKVSGYGFKVGVKRIDQSSSKEINFTWLIVNQE